MRNSWKNKPDNSLSHYFTESKMFLEYTSKKKKKNRKVGCDNKQARDSKKNS